jgi:Protein of unknown function (DUF2442)/Domain of unknown function (DUF4160)
VRPTSVFYEIEVRMPCGPTESGRLVFEARYRDEKTVVDVETLEAVEGSLGKTGMKLVREWATEHRQELRDACALAAEGRHAPAIEPLDGDFAAEPPAWEITEMKVVSHGVLRLEFADGLRGEVDLSSRLWGPIFERLRTPEGFCEAFLRDGAVCWPGEVDFAPDTLYERVRTGIWPEAYPA